MKDPQSMNKSEVKVALNKIQSLMTPETKTAFGLVVSAISAREGRAITTFTLPLLRECLHTAVDAYRAQQAGAATARADQKIHRKVRTYSEAAQEFIAARRADAAAIRQLGAKARQLAAQTGKTVSVRAGKLFIGNTEYTES